MVKKEVAKWWFAIQLDEGQKTEYFDAFNKSSRLSAVLSAVATRFDLPRNECLLIHKGKILSDGSKALIDCGIDRSETIMLYRRRRFNPINVDSTSPADDVEDTCISGELPTSQTDTEDDSTPCPECGISEASSGTISCDECHRWFHWSCLSAPITSLPDEEYWFCADCVNDTEEVIRPDNEYGHKRQRRAAKLRKERKGANGMANQGLTRLPPVSLTHRGNVPGIDVGQSWEKRSICHEDGVHRSLMGGICGRPGAVSICMGEGFDTNEDHGDWFLYTGSGGTKTNDPSASRTKQKQSKDQTLTQSNLAIAVTCDAKVCEEGAVAKNWRNSKAIRVVRKYSAKGGYAPAEGYRYDGLYRVVRYYRTEPLQNGFRRYIFEFRRDDPTPMPWTSAGKEVIEQLGLRMREASKPDDEGRGSQKKPNRVSLHQEASSQPPSIWNIPQSIRIAISEAILAIPSHGKIFEPFLAETFPGKYELVQFLRQNVTCPICQRFVDYPVTNPCGHIACLKCLQKCVKSDYGCRCTLCGSSWVSASTHDTAISSKKAKQKFLDGVEVDKHLVKVLRLCFGTLWEDFDIDNPKTKPLHENIETRESIKFRKVKVATTNTAQKTSASVVRSNKLVTFFASEFRAAENSSRARGTIISEDEVQGISQSQTPAPSFPSTQEIVDLQLFDSMGVEEPEDSHLMSKQLGFKELQALHFAQHNPSISELAVEEYRLAKRAEVHNAKQLKRAFSQMEPLVETRARRVHFAEAVVEFEDTDASSEERGDSRRKRRRSAKGLSMESSLRMFQTLDQFD